MNWSSWVRQIHRWMSIAFTLTVIANFIALAQGGGDMPPPWVTYSPLLPLALLLFSGLYLFVLPHTSRWAKWRRERGGVRALDLMWPSAQYFSVTVAHTTAA